MYSAVLMLALTAGNDAVDFGRKSCHGCTSTYGCTKTYVATTCSSACTTRPGLFHRCHGSTACSTPVYSGCSSSCHGGLFSKHKRCHGSTACSVYTSACSGTVVTPPVMMKPKDMPKGEQVPLPKKTSLNAPATIVVSLPADARLFVDGAPTTSTSERRSLVTPGLEFGSTYVYTVRAEVVRDGRTVEQTQEVTVRGGVTTPVRFEFSTQSVASR